MDDDAIRALVTRLARPHRSGGIVVERAAIMAEGADFDAVVAWITAHDGTPEMAAAPVKSRGLHGQRSADSTSVGAKPQSFVLPPGALD
jgi:hypothetical protein